MLLLLGDDEGLEQLLPDMFRDSAAVADRGARRVHPSPARGRAGARPRIDGASEIPRTAANSTLALCGLLPWRSTWLLVLPAARLVPPPHDVGGGRRLARGLAEAPGRASAPRCVHLPGTPGLLAYASAWQLASILQKLIWDRVGAGGPAAARCGCPTRAARPGRRRRRSAGRRGTAPRPGSTAPPRPEGAARRGRRRRATGRSGRRRRRTAGSHPQRRRTITARLPAVREAVAQIVAADRIVGVAFAVVVDGELVLGEGLAATAGYAISPSRSRTRRRSRCEEHRRASAAATRETISVIVRSRRQAAGAARWPAYAPVRTESGDLTGPRGWSRQSGNCWPEAGTTEGHTAWPGTRRRRMSACVAPLRHGAFKWTRTPVAPVRPWRSFTSYSDGDVRVDKLRHLYTAIVGRKGCG